MALPMVMVVSTIQTLARISPKAMVMADPRIGKKAKNAM